MWCYHGNREHHQYVKEVAGGEAAVSRLNPGLWNFTVKVSMHVEY